MANDISNAELEIAGELLRKTADMLALLANFIIVFLQKQTQHPTTIQN